jgi:hypothetical protein
MIERQFWEDAKKVWIVQAPPKIKDIKAGSGGSIDPSLLKEPWDVEGIPFDMVDFDGAVQVAFNGGEIPLKPGAVMPNQTESEPEPEKPKQPQLDTEKFDSLLENQTLPDYVEACKLLRKCELPEEMDELYASLIDRMPVLQDAIVKFESVYHSDMTPFYEYYIPEALQLTATYLEYLDVGIGEQIIRENEREVLDAVDKLLIAINDKIDEIYKFASIEIKAKAKALESLMSQDGYVDPNFKIN